MNEALLDMLLERMDALSDYVYECTEALMARKRRQRYAGLIDANNRYRDRLMAVTNLIDLDLNTEDEE